MAEGDLDVGAVHPPLPHPVEEEPHQPSGAEDGDQTEQTKTVVFPVAPDLNIRALITRIIRGSIQITLKPKFMRIHRFIHYPWAAISQGAAAN